MLLFKLNTSAIGYVEKALDSLKTDQKGQQKYEWFLDGLRIKLKAIEYSLRPLSGKDIIDEEGFSFPLSEARRFLEDCFVGGWVGFNRQGTGCFGKAVHLEMTLRAMAHSLGSYMVWSLPEKTAKV